MSLPETLSIERPLAPLPLAFPENRDVASAHAVATLEPLRPALIERMRAAISGGSMFRKGVLSLVDQGVVSATNFLTMVLLRHIVDHRASMDTAEHETGLYYLAFSLITLAISVQNAIISGPYTVFASRMTSDRRKVYAGSTLVHQWTLSALATAALFLAGLAALNGWGSPAFGVVALVLAAGLPFILVREFVRRFAFAHLQVVAVLLLDITAGALQLGALIALKFAGHLTAANAIGVMALASAVAGGAAYYFLRNDFAPQRGAAVLSDFRMNWSFGRWSSAAQLVWLVMAYCLSWILAIFVDTQATGRYAVCVSLVMFANPLLIGLSNFLGPQTIHAFNAHGISALRRLTIRTGGLSIACVGLLCAILIIEGGNLLELIYGANLQGQQTAVSILSVSLLMYAFSMIAENGLVALNRPQAMFWANLAGLIVTIAVAFPLIASQGIVGAAIASLAGTAASTVCKSGLFARECRQLAGRANSR